MVFKNLCTLVLWGEVSSALEGLKLYKVPKGHLQCLSQDLVTGCLKLAVVKFLGVQILKGYHNILIFQL